MRETTTTMLRRYAAGLLLAAAGLAQGQTLPPGLSWIARDAAGAWNLYRVDAARGVVRLPTELEPRQACVSADGTRAVYTAADGTLRTIDAGRESVLARPDAKRAYTQPCLDSAGRDVVAVEMADGKSIDTEILRFGTGGGEPSRIARQPGAQHDPFLYRGRWLAYANVHCSDGCERLIVEIWSRDLVAAEARQLTLLNALSQAPVTDGRRVVFSSNASGTFQLWEVGLDGSGLRRLTDGSAQATQPALCGGQLLFVRATPQGAAIARLEADGRVTEIPVPGHNAVRALRCLS